jgi:hypothetical protein
MRTCFPVNGEVQMDRGGWLTDRYTRITLFAITAAIPHALLLLHALIDLLPYPNGPKGMWYEIHTGTTECVDEVDPSGSLGEEEKDEFAGIGAIEAAEPERKSRLNVRLPKLLLDSQSSSSSRLCVSICISRPDLLALRSPVGQAGRKRRTGRASRNAWHCCVLDKPTSRLGRLLKAKSYVPRRLTRRR